MSKKIKPKSLIDGMPTMAEGMPMVDASGFAEQTVAPDISDANPLVGNGPMTAEAKEKLEKYDALEATVLQLTEEKQVLEAKVAEYAERLMAFESKPDEVKRLLSENEQLKKSIADSHVASKEVDALKKEAKALREEADGYLVKISELSFENANLTCQLEEASKQLASKGIAANQRQFTPNASQLPPGALRRPNVDPYNPYKNNGYGTW